MCERRVRRQAGSSAWSNVVAGSRVPPQPSPPFPSRGFWVGKATDCRPSARRRVTLLYLHPQGRAAARRHTGLNISAGSVSSSFIIFSPPLVSSPPSPPPLPAQPHPPTPPAALVPGFSSSQLVKCCLFVIQTHTDAHTPHMHLHCCNPLIISVGT